MSIKESISKARHALAEAVLRILKEGPARQARRAANKQDDENTGRSADAADINVDKQRRGAFSNSSSRSVDPTHVVPDEDRTRADAAYNAAADAARRSGANALDAMDAGNKAKYRALGRAFRQRTGRPRRTTT